MSPFIEEHREDLIRLCREFGVAKLEIFGPATTSELDLERSEIDLLVTYPPGYDFGPWIARYQDFDERLKKLLGHPVRLYMAQKFRNPYLAREVEETRQVLYSAEHP